VEQFFSIFFTEQALIHDECAFSAVCNTAATKGGGADLWQDAGNKGKGQNF
jgi:hypothetical protein